MIILARYLTKYVGTYRVKAMFDLSTNDYPRDDEGNIESTFDDIYIVCKSDSMIRHAYQDNLSAYIPSLQRGRKIINNIIAKYGNIIYEIDETSAEITFEFKDADIKKIAEMMEASTYGKSINAFSKKNLPKVKYTIPENELNQYKVLVKDIPFNQISKISKMIDGFDVIIIKAKGKKYDVKTERKKTTLKQKEFIHKIGMWDEFIEYVKKEVELGRYLN